MTIILYAHLVNAYAMPPHNHRPDATWPQSLKIDDRNDDVYQRFCTITATFAHPAAESFTLKLLYAPHSPEVQELIEGQGGQHVLPVGDPAANITLTLGHRDAPFLRRLAKAIRRAKGDGPRYLDRQWCWIRTRTAKSLENLASHLATYRRTAAPATRR